MAINIPRDPMLPSNFMFKGKKDDNLKDLELWLGQFLRSVEEYFKDTYKDISLGTSIHRSLSNTAITTDLDNGEFVIGVDGTANKLYTKISGTMFSVTLTEV